MMISVLKLPFKAIGYIFLITLLFIEQIIQFALGVVAIISHLVFILGVLGVMIAVFACHMTLLQAWPAILIAFIGFAAPYLAVPILTATAITKQYILGVVRK